jgi:hypothetical protein
MQTVEFKLKQASAVLGVEAKELQLAEELDRQIPRAGGAKALPRGRKRAGWEREFKRSLEAAARDVTGVIEMRIAAEIRGYRAGKKRLPEITVGGSKRSA